MARTMAWLWVETVQVPCLGQTGETQGADNVVNSVTVDSRVTLHTTVRSCQGESRTCSPRARRQSRPGGRLSMSSEQSDAGGGAVHDSSHHAYAVQLVRSDGAQLGTACSQARRPSPVWTRPPWAHRRPGGRGFVERVAPVLVVEGAVVGPEAHKEPLVGRDLSYRGRSGQRHVVSLLVSLAAHASE